MSVVDTDSTDDSERSSTYRIISAFGQELDRAIVSVTTEIVAKETPEIVEFSQLKSRTTADALKELVSEYGTVYVTALTRQGCSGCETQKPLFKNLAEKMNGESPGRVRFRSFHVNYQDGDKRESWSSKGVFGHAAYPTYMIHVKSHVGPLEIYRSVYPPMEELEKQIKESFELADFYKTQAGNASKLASDRL